MNPNHNHNPDHDHNADNGDSAFGKMDFGQALTELLSASQFSGNKHINLDLSTIEGQVRAALIESRTQQLKERYMTPGYARRMEALATGSIGNFERAMPDDSVHVSELENLQPGDFDKLAGEDGKITLNLGPTAEDMVAMFSAALSSPALAEINARNAATQEFMTEAEVANAKTAALELLQDQGVATGALEKVGEEAREPARAYAEFRKKVVERIIDIAHKEGVQAAVKPETYRSVARELATRDQYVEMRMRAIENAGEVFKDLGGIGEVQGGDFQQMTEIMNIAIVEHGQIERFETLYMYDIALDAQAIYQQ